MIVPKEPTELLPKHEPVPEAKVKEWVSSKTLKRGIRIFIGLAVVAAVVVVALTVSPKTLEGLKEIRWYWLALTAVLWLFGAWVDGLRLSVLSRAGEHRMGVIRSLEIILVGYFMAAVTPFSVGGLPLQLYSMNKWGISPGKASAMLFARGVLFYLLIFAFAPVTATGLGVSSVLLNVLAGYVAVMLGGLVVILVLALAFPNVIGRWQERLAAHPKPGWFRRLLSKGLVEAVHFINGLKLYFRGRNLLLLGLALMLTAVYGAAYLGMSATLLAGLGVMEAGQTLQVIGINLLLVAVLLYMPTPGAGGIAEAGAAALYSMLCPKYMLGIFVVLWRLFSFYVGVFVGGAVSLKHVTRN